jgi:hypothetical protein
MAKVSKNNNTNAIGGHTGGLPIIHDVAKRKAELKVPTPKVEQPATDEQKEPTAGPALAKASPAFKQVTPKAQASKEDEEEAIRKNLLVNGGNTSVSPANDTNPSPENT